jgi:hypothetical protein
MMQFGVHLSGVLDGVLSPRLIISPSLIDSSLIDIDSLR